MVAFTVVQLREAALYSVHSFRGTASGIRGRIRRRA
jgi:hypothetical protein